MRAALHRVDYLIAQKGLEVFMKLYDADDPEAAMPALYGASRAELVRRAGM